MRKALVLSVLFCLAFILLCALPKVIATPIWEKYSGNPVLDIGPSGSWDDQSVWAPTVLQKDGLHRMWYCGGRNSQYIRIGLATSTNGLSWTRFGSNPVLDVHSSEWDSLQASCPSVLFNGSHYCMWYSGGIGEANNRIGFATSDDGMVWTKYSGNPVFSGGRYCSVLYDGSIYKMWYEGYDYTIRYATSPDGVSWTEYGSNPVLVQGSSGSWDGMFVSTPSVVFNGSHYIMSYSGYRDSMFSRTIGIAYSPDGVNWAKNVNNPVVNVGPLGSWEDTFVDHSALFLSGSLLRMWYSGFDGTEAVSSPTYYNRIGLTAFGETTTVPLSVSISPLSASIDVGESVAFTSTADGGMPPYSYKWYLDGNPVSGATAQTWAFMPSSSGVYYVHLEVTDSLQPTGNKTQSETSQITVQYVPVGGYSISIEEAKSIRFLSPYVGLMAILTIGFLVAKRRSHAR